MPFKVNQLNGFNNSNKRAICDFISSVRGDTSSNVLTITGQDIGPAYAGRYVIVSITGNTNGRSISSVTIGGITATAHVSANFSVGIYGAYVPTGTTATIVITLNGNDNLLVAVYNVRGLRSTTAYASTTGTESPSGTLTATLNIANGFYLAVVGSSHNGVGTWTWTNITEDVDAATTSGGQRYASMASSPSYRETSVTITSTQSPFGGGRWMSAAAFT